MDLAFCDQPGSALTGFLRYVTSSQVTSRHVAHPGKISREAVQRVAAGHRAGPAWECRPRAAEHRLGRGRALRLHLRMLLRVHRCGLGVAHVVGPLRGVLLPLHQLLTARLVQRPGRVLPRRRLLLPLLVLHWLLWLLARLVVHPSSATDGRGRRGVVVAHRSARHVRLVDSELRSRLVATGSTTAPRETHPTLFESGEVFSR